MHIPKNNISRKTDSSSRDMPSAGKQPKLSALASITMLPPSCPLFHIGYHISHILSMQDFCFIMNALSADIFQTRTAKVRRSAAR